MRRKTGGEAPAIIGRMLTVSIVSSLVVALSSAWAALGQSASSVERDRTVMKGQRQTRTGDGYSIETITSAGLTVKEYVSADGHVFAVTWSGTGAPNLSVLLGEYFPEYRNELAARRERRPRARGPLTVKTPRLVVERGGHSRFLWGRAYLPDALPSGVAAEDIR
ncbi:MAG TPA: DUF2844 domain-containing protein [Nitrospira sp.]|nr:DUF2844 domain-containing protein [Nitrospira sp.]